MVDRLPSWITESPVPGQLTGHHARQRDYVSPGLTSVGGEHPKGADVVEIEAFSRQLVAEFSREIVIAGRLVSPITSDGESLGREISVKGEKFQRVSKITACRRILNAVESGTRGLSQRKSPSRGANVNYFA
jgi:hypothetical protein